jgi:hypothetical protein
MNGDPADRHGVRDLAAAHPEVEFALVLARTIDSIRADPEQLRGAIYELARQKLREQFMDENPSEIVRLTAALEVAIQGVEAHSRKDRELQRPIGVPRNPDRVHERMRALEAPPASVLVDDDRPAQSTLPPARRSDSAAHPSKQRKKFAAAGRFILIAGLVLAIAAIIRSGQFSTRDKTNAPAVPTAEKPNGTGDQNTATGPAVEPPKAAPLLPTTFGVYAVSAEKLYELEPLQFRAPDIRVAVSTVITTPSRTVLPDGNLRFIVFRRDASGSAPDQADVRVVAKIEQAMNFDPSGKPVISKTEENWVMRNISFPYRTAPIKDSPEMYEVQSKDPNGELTPGRYVLVIKGQAYDFTVAGNVTDTRQCLGRVSAANGTFYSECQKLQ